jgi:hypothetical protein
LGRESGASITIKEGLFVAIKFSISSLLNAVKKLSLFLSKKQIPLGFSGFPARSIPIILNQYFSL